MVDTNDEKDETQEKATPTMEDISDYIGFKVKARATDANIEAHKTWKQRAWDEHDGDYTALIRADNRRAQRDWKFESLQQQIEDLQRRVALIERNMASQGDAEDDTDDSDVF